MHIHFGGLWTLLYAHISISSFVPVIKREALDAVEIIQQAAPVPHRGSYLGDHEPDYEYEEPMNNTLHGKFPDSEEDSEIDQGDSEVSEERNGDRGIFIGDNRIGLKEVKPVKPDDGRKALVAVISSAFNNKKTFSCPKIKTDLKTGTSIGDLSPEDIGIISSMGDALATGMGLWPKTNIEFRGAAFPIGGDATIDGLVTIPNILREFNARLIGVSHGMGSRDQLPETQFSVAESGATTDKMPEQAWELVRRIKNFVEVDYRQEWVMIIITIGTEEVCSRCTSPNYTALVEAIDILQSSLPKAFVVLLGPIHVSFPYKLKGNLLKVRCACSKEASNEVMEQLSDDWKMAFEMLQDHVDNSPFRAPTFGLLALPELTITSRYPYGLFIPNKPLLNRRGHNYATKWLWNRLIAGNNYNLSAAVLSQDAYFCPSTGCPYFRNTANEHGCQLLSLSEAKEKELALGEHGKIVKMPRRTRERLYTIAICIVCIAFFVVCTLGTVFYQKSKQGDHGRFEMIDETQKKFEEAQKEEERTLINRHNTRVHLSNEGLLKQNVRKLTTSGEGDI